MPPALALPISDSFDDVEEYVESSLRFTTTSTLFQTLCGGVHILDFFTREPSLYDAVIPEEWRSWLLACDSMELLDLLIRDDLDSTSCDRKPPASLLGYIKDVRKHSLGRSYTPKSLKQTILPRHVAVGMVPKKIHEVTNFANYVDSLAEEIALQAGQDITHFVDFGSGQNYLGRTLASPPYNRHIIAVESKKLNISGAKGMDVLAKVAKREVVMRNKKIYRAQLGSLIPPDLLKDKALRRTAKSQKASSPAENVADLRPSRDLATIYTSSEGKGSIQYVEHIVNDGDLSNVIQQVKDPTAQETSVNENDQRLMAMSIHSCGNLSHHGIRSLLLNPSVKAIAIVGCCYNLLTERLGPPTYKLPILRPHLQPINARVARESAACDPHGFPMSKRISEYNNVGVRLNITARMMAVQAPQNWTSEESDAFFTRHYFRALLQKVFLDYGVVSKPNAAGESNLESEGTEPIIIGSLRKSCYGDFKSYVRGAISKLSTDPARRTRMIDKLGSITDEEIVAYAQRYAPRKKELSVMWSLMAFSAGVVESLIVVDRWLFLREHPAVVKNCWVEAVFDYKQSPRNLVVVGIK
ncbi:MAG: hypothetical protein M1818_007213 [Claussenomyces sp. TS43310]|nr:MAG: hypothetical protein M1818_007213 [Claussenomyces sp. TS43310]